MPDTPTEFASYAIQYSDTAKQTRKELPEEAILVLFDVIDKLAENPNAFPNWTRPLSRDGRTRVYAHPSPALQITYEIDERERLLYLLHFVAPKVQLIKPVFISYSHKDSAWLERLKMYLSPLEDQGLLRIWDDTNIRPGSEWLQEIRNSIESARVAVFLITQNFLTSEFIRQKEFPALLQKAKDRGCVIFWIAVSASTVDDTDLAQYQAANDPKQPLDSLKEPDQNLVLKSIYERMKEAVR